MPRAGETLSEWELDFETVSKTQPTTEFQHNRDICKSSVNNTKISVGKAAMWWIKKINNTKDYPIGTDKFFKCLYCQKTYLSQEALDKHHLDAKKTKKGTCVPARGGWKEEYAVDTMENRLNWWKRS